MKISDSPQQTNQTFFYKTKFNFREKNEHLLYIGENGGKAIAEALKVNTTVTSINLEWNEIGDDGAEAIEEALWVNTTVTSIE